MVEDMTIRGFTAKTQASYIRAVKDFTAFLGRFPAQASSEDLWRYQLWMRSSGASATSMNAAVSALRFFFTVTLGRSDAQAGMTTLREPRKLPAVLSPEEVARLLEAALRVKNKTSKFPPDGLVASQIRAIQRTPQRPTATRPSSNPHRPSRPHRRA